MAQISKMRRIVRDTVWGLLMSFVRIVKVRGVEEKREEDSET
jgi:hypothetical protein